MRINYMMKIVFLLLCVFCSYIYASEGVVYTTVRYMGLEAIPNITKYQFDNINDRNLFREMTQNEIIDRLGYPWKIILSKENEIWIYRNLEFFKPLNKKSIVGIKFLFKNGKIEKFNFLNDKTEKKLNNNKLAKLKKFLERDIEAIPPPAYKPIHIKDFNKFFLNMSLNNEIFNKYFLGKKSIKNIFDEFNFPSAIILNKEKKSYYFISNGYLKSIKVSVNARGDILLLTKEDDFYLKEARLAFENIRRSINLRKVNFKGTIQLKAKSGQVLLSNKDVLFLLPKKDKSGSLFLSLFITHKALKKLNNYFLSHKDSLLPIIINDKNIAEPKMVTRFSSNSIQIPLPSNYTLNDAIALGLIVNKAE